MWYKQRLGYWHWSFLHFTFVIHPLVPHNWYRELLRTGRSCHSVKLNSPFQPVHPQTTVDSSQLLLTVRNNATVLGSRCPRSRYNYDRRATSGKPTFQWAGVAEFRRYLVTILSCIFKNRFNFTEKYWSDNREMFKPFRCGCSGQHCWLRGASSCAARKGTRRAI